MSAMFSLDLETSCSSSLWPVNYFRLHLGSLNIESEGSVDYLGEIAQNKFYMGLNRRCR